MNKSVNKGPDPVILRTLFEDLELDPEFSLLQVWIQILFFSGNSTGPLMVPIVPNIIRPYKGTLYRKRCQPIFESLTSKFFRSDHA
jgi:hypothetical protein